MYNSNVISFDSFHTMMKIEEFSPIVQASVMTDLLKEHIIEPLKYNIFKESLKQRVPLKTLYHKIDYVG